MGVRQKIVRKGVRGEGGMGTMGSFGAEWKQGLSGMRNVSARMATDDQSISYHTYMVLVNSNFKGSYK